MRQPVSQVTFEVAFDQHVQNIRPEKQSASRRLQIVKNDARTA